MTIKDGVETAQVEEPIARWWNYRVIEFVDPKNNEPWRSIHEVHYQDGRPASYSGSPAHVTWDVSEGNSAAETMLEKMREALAKPVLVEIDFMTPSEE